MISQALVMAIGVYSNPRGPIRSFTGKFPVVKTRQNAAISSKLEFQGGRSLHYNTKQ
jgi:hypothetical protein